MAATLPIEFAGHAPSFDPLSGAGVLINVQKDSGNALRSRPGIKTWDDFPSEVPDVNPVIAMHYWSGGDNGKGALIWVTQDSSGDRRAFALCSDGRLSKLSDAGGTHLIAGAGQIQFADTRTHLIITGGAAPQLIDPSFDCNRLGGSPPDAIAVTVVSRRIVLAAADGSGRMYWSDVLESGLETYDTAFEFREAEAQADDQVSLGSTSRFLYSFGKETVQTFSPDATETFAPASTIDEGAVSVNGQCKYESRFGWMSNRRRIILSDVFDFNPASVISGPIAKDLEQLETVTDCWAYREYMPPFDLLVFCFPTEGRAWAYDVPTKTWSERRGFSGGLWAPWAPSAYAKWGNVHLVGLADGTIGQLTMDAHTDKGSVIKCVARSGFTDRGQGVHKWSFYNVTARRGESVSEDAAIAMRWRDDLGPFQSSVYLPLGTAGDSLPTMDVTPTPPYQQREIELAWSADEAVTVSKVDETFDILEQ